MKCQKCGKETNEGMFCRYCGAKLVNDENSESTQKVLNNYSLTEDQTKKENNTSNVKKPKRFRKVLYVILGIFVILMIIGIFAPESDTQSTGVKSSKSEVNKTTQNDDNKTTKKEDKGKSADCEYYNIFADIEVSFSGFTGKGKMQVKNNTSIDALKKAKFICENDGSLNNGDYIEVKVEYDENLEDEGYALIKDTELYEVEGLSYINGRDSHDFNNDVAWCRTMDYKAYWVCIDSNGKILFELDKGDIPSSDFVNGIALVNENKIIDKGGNIVWSTDKEGKEYFEKIYGKDCVSEINIDTEHEFLGYALMKAKIDTFDYSGEYWGVIGKDGEWYSEPYKGQISYVEDGLYECTAELEETTNTNFVYNILTNEIFDAQGFGQISDRKEYNKYVYDAYKHGGLILGIYSKTGKLAIFDENLNFKVDLSKYGNEMNTEGFIDGYCILQTVNEGGTEYYTLIDGDGNEIIEPQKEMISQPTDGIICKNGTEYYDMDNNLIYKGVTKDGFHNGHALVEENNSAHYADKTGNIIF